MASSTRRWWSFHSLAVTNTSSRLTWDGLPGSMPVFLHLRPHLTQGAVVACQVVCLRHGFDC